MDEKNKEIIKQRNRQIELKKQIDHIKKTEPIYVSIIITLIIIGIYAVEEQIIFYLGKNFNFITSSILIIVILGLSYILKSYVTIQKKRKEIKLINNKLYNLMKLETQDRKAKYS